MSEMMPMRQLRLVIYKVDLRLLKKEPRLLKKTLGASTSMLMLWLKLKQPRSSRSTNWPPSPRASYFLSSALGYCTAFEAVSLAHQKASSQTTTSPSSY
jgi:hypothetical protein